MYRAWARCAAHPLLDSGAETNDAWKEFTCMNPPRILITGGSGFVGLAILRLLVERHEDWMLIVADLVPLDQDFATENTIEFIETDVTDEQQCLRAVKTAKPTVIIHAAGKVPGGLTRYGKQGRDSVFAVNVGGSKNMLAAANACSVPSFIYTGSCTSITDDLDHDYPNFNEEIPYPARSLTYGESKAAAEKLVLDANGEKLATCSLKPSVILGREDYQLIPSIHACIAKGETPFVIGSGNNLYDFTFVDNVAHAHVLAVENLLTTRTVAGEAILISNDQPITFRDFMLAIWAQFDHVPPFSLNIPAPMATLFGSITEWAGWLTGSKTTLCRGSVKDALGTRYASQEKAKHLLGYEPTVDIWDGVRVSCDALKERIAKRKREAQRKDSWGHEY